MNSRDHIMFGGPGKWIYNYVGGIGQEVDSIGFEHVVLSPPATLIEQAIGGPAAANTTTSAPLEWATASHKTLRGMIALEWALPAKQQSAQCDVENENSPVALACPGSTIATVSFAGYGTFSGDCASGIKMGTCKSNATFNAFVNQCCVGKESCSFSCSSGSNAEDHKCTCGKQTAEIADPCYGTPKQLAGKVTCAAAPSAGGATLALKVSVPPGSDSRLVVPLLGSDAAKVVITENGTTVFTGGAYKTGAAGVTGAVVGKDSISIMHGSGDYVFERTG
jgi:hypothetical protein